MEGWIKIYRKILENPIICKDSDYLAVWIYLLLNATHKEYDTLFKGKRITLNKGELLTGIITISKKLKINKDKVQRILKSFENDKQINQQTSNKNRLISIVNWNSYQENDKQNNKQVINKCETTDKQVITNKNEKNIKNIKNNKLNEFNLYNNFNKNLKCDCVSKSTNKQCEKRSTYNINGINYCNQHSKGIIDKYFKEQENQKKTIENIFRENSFSKELEDTFRDFIDMRKTIKKPMTAKALELLIKNLNRLTNLEEEKIAILNQSIEHSWQTVYPLKKGDSDGGNKPNNEKQYLPNGGLKDRSAIFMGE